MNKINIGLIGYGNVGTGVVKFLQSKKAYLKEKFHTNFSITCVCDLYIKKCNTKGLGKATLTTDYHTVLNDPKIDVVVELIGGMHPAKEIVFGALEKGKHVVTANKSLIAHYGKELFKAAQAHNCCIFFESSVMAGVPVVKLITEGIAGNLFNGLYGIINGTCNYILSEMTENKYSFEQALKDAQKKGFAESDPTLDINGMDSAHKIAILVALSLGKFIKIKDIHTEGIIHISHQDIEYANDMGLTIKLLGIAKKIKDEIEVRVHPTLIDRKHPLASINGINNAIFIDADPLGDVLLSGEGAGQMAAASGVISDLVNLAHQHKNEAQDILANSSCEFAKMKIKKIDQISTKFYIRFMATDKPGVLSKISGILGAYGISINSVSQKVHKHQSTVPVIMITDYAPEKKLRLALNEIHKLSIVKSKPIAIRMENL
ncbi:MAG: homoserine dehydrogenase [Candidatus Omnitrophica bacterium]|nr:homoserine dehydrogenase [Candidatus Omnitrophota bacterium]